MNLSPVQPAAPPAQVSTVRAIARTTFEAPVMPRDRWVSQAPPLPEPPPDSPDPDPWKEVPETVASSAIHGLAAGGIGAIIGALLGGPVGAAIGAGIGTGLAQGFMQALLGMADGGNTPRHRLAAALPGALALAGGVIGGVSVGAVGVTVGLLGAPLLALGGYGLYRALR